MTRFSWSSASCTRATTSSKVTCGASTAGIGTTGATGVEEVLDHHHRVVPLLDRLAVEVGGELRRRLRVVVDGDCDVLLRRAEFVRDLLVEGIRGERNWRGL